MDHFISASPSYTPYLYEVGKLKVLAIHVILVMLVQVLYYCYNNILTAYVPT